MRKTEIENARKDMQSMLGDVSELNKFGLKEEEPLQQQQLRHLGGLGRLNRSEALAKESAKPCTFSGMGSYQFYIQYTIFCVSDLFFNRKHCGCYDCDKKVKPFE